MKISLKAITNNANNTLPFVSDRIADTTRRWTEEEIMEINCSNWPWVPTFRTMRNEQTLALSILTAARNDNYALSLEYLHRTSCFE